jgi:hypothetical protein
VHQELEIIFRGMQTAIQSQVIQDQQVGELGFLDKAENFGLGALAKGSEFFIRGRR